MCHVLNHDSVAIQSEGEQLNLYANSVTKNIS